MTLTFHDLTTTCTHHIFSALWRKIEKSSKHFKYDYLIIKKYYKNQKPNILYWAKHRSYIIKSHIILILLAFKKAMPNKKTTGLLLLCKRMSLIN